MNNDIFDMSEFDKQSKEIDNSYCETYKALEKADKNFSATKCISIMTKFKTEQVKRLIGQNISEYDENVLAGVIERHIAGVVFKG